MPVFDAMSGIIRQMLPLRVARRLWPSRMLASPGNGFTGSASPVGWSDDSPECSRSAVGEKNRVLVLTSTFPRWSGDTEPGFVFELSKRLVTQFRVHVLAPHAPAARFEEQMEGVSVSRFRYSPDRLETLTYNGGILARIKQNPWRVLLIPAFLVAEVVAVVRQLRRHRFDVIHAHWLVPQGVVAVLARSLVGQTIPILCTSHGGDLYAWRGRFGRLLKRYVVKRCEAITVVSQVMQGEVVGLGADSRAVSVIPMGTDLQERFTPGQVNGRDESILFVGRLVEKKGLKFLIDAFPTILQRYPSASLTVVGSGPEERLLRRRSAGLGLQRHVRFVGAKGHEGLPEMFRQHQVVVFPSVVSTDGDQEGFGLVLVEALGCGCAVVCTDLPAMRDIVRHGVTGLVVPERDPPALAEATSKLLEDEALREKLASNGRAHVAARYGWDNIGREYSGIIAGICAGGTSSQAVD